MKVAVLDYGSGNVRSACRALERAGAEVSLTRDGAEVAAADGLVVPGVGAYGAVMEQLRDCHGDQMIERRLAGGRAVLGICVGLQVMFEGGEEHGFTAGLEQWPGRVVALKAPVIPHMGWSPVHPPEGSRLFAGVENERFYFVHSYAVTSREVTELGVGSPLTPPLVTWAHHGEDFIAAVENGALTATQFHPEKSGAAGIKLLENWLATIREGQ